MIERLRIEVAQLVSVHINNVKISIEEIRKPELDAQLVAEGHDPVLIEWAGRSAGMVVPPLQVFDEVTLTLPLKASVQSQKYLGEASVDNDALALIRAMVETHERGGKAAGAGFYEYKDGRRKRLWSGLDELAKGTDNPEINRMLGSEGSLGAMLGLDADWAARAIAAVGNYGEIFERTIGENTPIGLARGYNALWTQGGLQYSPPFR